MSSKVALHLISSKAGTSRAAQIQRKRRVVNKSGKAASSKNDLWLASSFSFKRQRPENAWDLLRGEPSQTNKFLELADVALGLMPTKRKA